MWDLAVAGHVRADESSVEAVLRETEEEIGVRLDEKDLRFITSFRHTVQIKEDFIENSYYDFFIVYKDIAIEKLKIQTEEVQAVKWMSLEEVQRLRNKNKLHPRTDWLKYAEKYCVSQQNTCNSYKKGVLKMEKNIVGDLLSVSFDGLKNGAAGAGVYTVHNGGTISYHSHSEHEDGFDLFWGVRFPENITMGQVVNYIGLHPQFDVGKQGDRDYNKDSLIIVPKKILKEFEEKGSIGKRNIIDYDDPKIQKYYPELKPEAIAEVSKRGQEVFAAQKPKTSTYDSNLKPKGTVNSF